MHFLFTFRARFAWKLVNVCRRIKAMCISPQEWNILWSIRRARNVNKKWIPYGLLTKN